jgi:DNA topoisomerase-1
VQIGDREEMGEDEKPRFANLNVGQSIETITLEEALELFKLARSLKTYKGKEGGYRIGRFWTLH